jgi:phosphopantothenoylcysteine synthetase/decarboxylase
MLGGKRVVLGVSGGIAAYKAIEVCRRLVDAGAHVVPVLTEGALHFVGRTTFDAWARSGPGRRCGTTPTRSRTPTSARPPTW